MLSFPGITPVDYLIIGHITQDIYPNGWQPGGTAAFAGLTAHAFGQRVGLVTAWAEENGKEHLSSLQIANLGCEQSTTFENVYTSEGRQQLLHHLAPQMAYYHIPESWRSTPIIHLAPVAGEVPVDIFHYFPDADIYLTPQGWLREWDEGGNIFPSRWLEATYLLPKARAAVISEEDVSYDQTVIDQMAAHIPVLAVTKGEAGADVYTEGKIYHFPAPESDPVDVTGAGDIFAATFFTQLTHCGDPYNAGELAVLVASDSVTRQGLQSPPTEEIIFDLLRKVS
jgi:hypothetical protein